MNSPIPVWVYFEQPFTCVGVAVRKVWQCWMCAGEPGSLARKEKRQLEGSHVA